MSLALQLIWILFILSAFLPMLRQKRLERARVRHLELISRKRGSRVITLLHRQESVSFLGFMFRRFINIEDSEQILRAIRLTPDNVPIDLVLHTPGGLVLASEQIARAVKGHPARVSVFIPHYAMSGGTMIALAADEIHMDENAVLGPVDPQLGSYPAVSILKVLEEKDRNEIDDETLIRADMARKAVRQVYEVVYDILADRMSEENARRIAVTLTEGRWTHDYPITCRMLKEMGLNVKCDLPPEIYQLMELYPQAPQRRPSVQYVPLPPNREGEDGQ